MKCPYCSAKNDKVVDSRENRGGLAIRRRRECVDCGRRFTTYERIEDIPYMVVKRDGSRAEFDRGKLLTGLRKACEKRPVSPRDLEAIVDGVERRLSESEEREMSTPDIGTFVMSRLQDLDQVAYVRFASVYREFEDIEAFMDEVRNLVKQRS